MVHFVQLHKGWSLTSRFVGHRTLITLMIASSAIQKIERNKVFFLMSGETDITNDKAASRTLLRLFNRTMGL